jgi:hypothetical protein
MAGANKAYIKELVEDRQDHFAALHKQIRANRDLRYRRHKIEVPEAYKSTTTEIRTSLVADMLFRVVATLTTDEPTITVPPFSATEKAKRNASLRERWSTAALHQMMQEVQRNVLRMGIDAAVADSLCIWKLIERKDAWVGFPARRRAERTPEARATEDSAREKRAAGEDVDEEEAGTYLARTDKFVKGQPFPLTWIDIDPLTYYPVRSTYGVTEVVEVTQRPAIPAMKAFGKYRIDKDQFGDRQPGEAMPEDSNYAGQTWDCIEHWDGSYVTYILDDIVINQRKVDYCRPPYFECGGHTTSSRKPEEQYQSVIQPFAHLVPALDAILTMMTNWGFFAAFPYLVKDQAGQPVTAGPSDPTNVTSIKPGDILENVRFLEAPQTSKALSDLVNLLNMMIDRSGLAAVMYGQGASSSSGYMVSQLMTAAQLVYAPIVDNARMALQDMIPFMWRLVEKRKGRTVYVWGAGEGKGSKDWLGLGPDDIDGYYACEVTIKPLLPMDEIAQRDSALRMVKGGLWSKEHAREHTGLGQPEEEADQIAVEQYMDSPKVNELIVMDAARKAGLIKPEPVPQPVPQGPPQILGQNGMPMPQQGANMQGLGGFQASPPIQPTGPLSPGQGLPMAPPMPAGVGGPPVGVQRQPANMPTRPGVV